MFVLSSWMFVYVWVCLIYDQDIVYLHIWYSIWTQHNIQKAEN